MRNWGEQLPGSGCDRAPCLCAQKLPPNKRYQEPEDDRIRSTTQIGRGGDTSETEGPAAGTPPGANRNLGADWGRQRGDDRTRDTTAEAGPRRGAQRRAAEAGGWRGREKSRWTMHTSGGGGGERMLYIERGGMTTNATREGWKKGGKNKTSQKTAKTGGEGRDRISCNH